MLKDNINELTNNFFINKLTQNIANEFENRNIFPLTFFSIYLNSTNHSLLTKKCLKLNNFLLNLIKQDVFFAKLLKNSKKKQWIRSAIEFSRSGNKYDYEQISMHIAINLIQQKMSKIDDHISLLNNNSLCKQFGINIDDDFLTDISVDNLSLKNHGIFKENSILIYPHQFLRRFYSANFVGMPFLLNKAQQAGAITKIRIDPIRSTTVDNYREVFEADHWYGPKFSKEILMDKYSNTRTQHTSAGYYCFSYEAEKTIFRTKMMDNNLREFTIEEYCPQFLAYGDTSPGFGKNKCIQKFAHFIFDQSLQKFVHIDGAVRVFNIEEYLLHFKQVQQGLEVNEKIGKRHKIFLVEGKLNQKTVEDLLTEWFRYNPHIQEYFSNTKIKPLMTFKEYEKIKKTRK